MQGQRTKAPTGNPNIPPTVHEATTIRLLITEKTKGLTGSEHETFVADDDEEAEDKEDHREGDAYAAAGEMEVSQVSPLEQSVFVQLFLSQRAQIQLVVLLVMVGNA